MKYLTSPQKRLLREAKTKVRLFVIQGSPRIKNNCPDQDSKTKLIVDKAVRGLPKWIEIDRLDLGVEKGNIVQPCKGCVGTAGGYHCHYSCSCYGPGSAAENLPDLMYDENVYERLEDCDAFVVFSPIHWYSVSTQVKAMFDRLVCISMTLTQEESNRLGIGKNATISRRLAKAGTYDHLLKNHLEGRYAGFFVHGDDGADDFSGRKLPLALTKHWAHEKKTNDPKEAVAPLVAQCRYSGIFVPDDCIIGMHINRNKDYATANDAIKTNNRIFKTAKDLLIRLAKHTRDGKPA